MLEKPWDVKDKVGDIDKAEIYAKTDGGTHL